MKSLGISSLFATTSDCSFVSATTNSSDGMLYCHVATESQPTRASKISAHGRAGVRSRLPAVGVGLDPRASGALRDNQHEAFFLLLEWSAATYWQPCSLGFPQFAISGLVRACDLGIGSCDTAKAARGMAFWGTDFDLPHGVLLCFPACALPPSHRTGIIYPGGVFALRDS